MRYKKVKHHPKQDSLVGQSVIFVTPRNLIKSNMLQKPSSYATHTQSKKFQLT